VTVTRFVRRWLFATIVASTIPGSLAFAATPRAAAVLPAPPAASPSGLTAVASSTRVTLAWAAVDGATGYKIFRADAGVWNPAPVASVSGLAYTNSALTNGVTYSYRIAAFNRGGVGPQSAEAIATPLATPAALTAAAGDHQVTLTWQPSAGAASYIVYRSTSSTDATFVAVASDVDAPPFLDTGLVNKTKYYYRVRAVAPAGTSALSAKVSATPLPPPPAASPANLSAIAGNARITLTWSPVADALSYRVFRTTTGTFGATPVATVTSTTFKNTGLINGTAYTYRVAGRNDGGDGPFSDPVTATPIAAPAAPTGVTAAAGDRRVTVAWAPVPEATAYSVYRSTRSGRVSSTPIASALTDGTFVDGTVENGPAYFYTIVASNAGGNSPRSAEASATPEGAPLAIDPDTTAAFRLLRQATWGPKPGDVDRVKAMGLDGFLSEQLALPASSYPDSLFAQPIEMAQEHFMRLALTGPDQLRQRVAWALHKIWVVSAVEVDSAPGIVTYHRILLNGAFGNYRDLMRALTLNPAMGRYLNMLNNRSQLVTGVPPNENYAREVMQLFTLGTAQLDPAGTPVLAGGAPVPTYTQDDVKALARILTGWTFGDGNPGTVPRRLANENYKVPMEAVVAYHDAQAKIFLGQSFMAGQSAVQDLDQALDVLFNHPNLGPFVSRQLIQQLVMSNPSPEYVGAVAAVFNDNGGGVRGDLASVVRAILTRPEAAATVAPNAGKLSEPVLFVTSIARALNANVTDHPFMSDKAEEMGQKVFYPPSVFSYFSPGYRVRGTNAPGAAPLNGPEFQILTSVTALSRVNFAGELLGGFFGGDATVDYSPFTSRARDAAALVDYCNLLFMGGQMSAGERAEIITAVRRTAFTDTAERAKTAIYLILVMAQTQVDR
jgi:uncharacterized protein (DUF1800 family)/fibronectin type 3 domain-containing protein